MPVYFLARFEVLVFWFLKLDYCILTAYEWVVDVGTWTAVCWRLHPDSAWWCHIVVRIWIYLLCCCQFTYHFTFNIFQLSMSSMSSVSSMCSDGICACGRSRLMQHQSLSWWIRPGGSNGVQQIVPFWRLGPATSGHQAEKSYAKELNLSWTRQCGRHPLPCHHERCTSCTVRTLLISREGLGI